MDTHVNRIRLPRSELPPHCLAFQYEDALRTNIDDHGKLVVIRQLRVGPPSARTGPAPVVARAWQDVCNTLCHGASAGTGAQNAIWFRDREEAVLLLLEWRLRGRDVSAWFWRLAVPEGVALPVVEWIGQILREYLNHNSVDAAVRLMTVIGSHADATVRTQLIEKLLADARVRSSLPSCGTNALRSMTPELTDSDQKSSEDVLANDTFLSEHADVVFEQLPAPLRRVLRSLARSTGQEEFVAEICGALVWMNIPTGQATQINRVTLTEFIFRRLRGDLPPAVLPSRAKQSVPRPDTKQRDAPKAVESLEPRLPRRDDKRDIADVAAPFNIPATAKPLPDKQVDAAEPSRQPSPAFAGEMATGAAGLYLTLLPLWHLDWPGFLARNRQWIEHKPTAQLIAFIAKHHRLGTDPLGQYWSEQAAAQTVAIPAETLALWRIALDRWLRRRAKLNLASLVKRRGWVDIHHETVRLRFPADSADIRLRRLALDRDPGWLDWLGQSVRYIYSDQPTAFGGVLS